MNTQILTPLFISEAYCDEMIKDSSDKSLILVKTFENTPLEKLKRELKLLRWESLWILTTLLSCYSESFNQQGYKMFRRKEHIFNLPFCSCV